ncbi:MAG: NADH-quinone oxidoreductase subunit A [Nitrospira sp.]|nr:NADH-quinone oxidoreductase subunit A [Nitrospira sp.]
MLLTYFPVLIIVGFVGFIAFMTLTINALVSSKRQNSEKLTPWECGMDPIGNAAVGHFRIHFFIVAILFLVFDVETLFLFPWAVVLRSTGLFAFVEMFIFVAILVIGLVYVWKKGALEWT